jgi:CRISPR system Cascade subunit CasB
MKPEEVRARASRLLDQLELWSRQEERGILARLRRGLSDTTRQEAWSVLGPNFGRAAVGCSVYETVAGCFALHPVPAPSDRGNFGETMRMVLAAKRREDARKDNETHARFRRLLACSDTEEICRHIRHVIRLAKSCDESVDYRLLFRDLWYWGPETKTQWARSYWRQPDDTGTFSLASFGTPAEEEPVPIPE